MSTNYEQQPEPAPVINAVANQMVQTAYVNVAQKLIVTTEDKVRLCLNERMDNIQKRDAWTTPAGILLTILITFATTTFRDSFFPKDTWQAIFVIAAVLLAAWLIRALLTRPSAQSVNDIINQMKQGTVA